MSKTVKDIIESVGLEETERGSLRERIVNKYMKVPTHDGYRKRYSDEDFTFIVEKELLRKSLIFPENYYFNIAKEIYLENRERGFFQRLTIYGGVDREYKDS